MNWHALTSNKAVRSTLGAALSVICGLVLWKSSWSTPLVNWSYDSLWIFGSREITNKVTFVMMDEDAYQTLHQIRGKAWDRRLHGQLLDRLAVDNCSIVVMDGFFPLAHHPQDGDQDLARAIKRHSEIALRAAYLAETNSGKLQPVLPSDLFLNAASRRWGVSHFEPDADGIVRRHWPFPSPGVYPSLAETAARTSGAALGKHERWIRYYGEQLPWTRISYSVALKEPSNFFHEQCVFVGVVPKSPIARGNIHQFWSPYSHWTKKAYVGTDLLITEYLNLVNHESLYLSAEMELWVLVAAGVVIGAILARLRFARACIAAAGMAIIVVAGAVMLTSATNYWFPFLLIVFGQLPVALVWSLANAGANQANAIEAMNNRLPRAERAPKIPGYQVAEPAFGHGAYGTVWLAKNKNGEWRALKAVSLESFGNDREPYDREYEGVSRYRGISEKHPGLLRVEFVSEKYPTHFYYVMELGEALEGGWEKSPDTYKPRDLNNVRLLAPQKRLPIEECLRIGIALSDALDFLHRSGFTHRDIKPQNILFVNGQPKLADVGLITHIREVDSERTAVGTPAYMPPPPEMPGTLQADIYALGMVLYVVSTGRSPTLFPELSETLLGGDNPTDFFLLNSVVLKACQPDPKERFASAAEMRRALEELQAKVAK